MMLSSKLGRLMGLVGLGLLSLTPAPNVLAQSAKPEAQAPETQIPWTLEGVTVSASHHGPAMWRVEKDGQEVWILGVPGSIENNGWDTHGVEKALREVNIVYTRPITRVNLLSPQAWGLGVGLLIFQDYNLRHGEDLERLAGPDLWSRTLTEASFSGVSPKDLHHFRPFFAAFFLDRGADKTQHLADPEDKVVELATHLHIKTKPAAVYPGAQLITVIARTPDTAMVPCLGVMVDVLRDQRQNLPRVTKAFANGDLRTLERTISAQNPYMCIASAAHIDGLAQRSVADTMHDITSALARNEKAFFVLSLTPLLRQDGVLARLRAEGYRVDTPGD